MAERRLIILIIPKTNILDDIHIDTDCDLLAITRTTQRPFDFTDSPNFDTNAIIAVRRDDGADSAADWSWISSLSESHDVKVLFHVGGQGVASNVAFSFFAKKEGIPDNVAWAPYSGGLAFNISSIWKKARTSVGRPETFDEAISELSRVHGECAQELHRRAAELRSRIVSISHRVRWKIIADLGEGEPEYATPLLETMSPEEDATPVELIIHPVDLIATPAPSQWIWSKGRLLAPFGENWYQYPEACISAFIKSLENKKASRVLTRVEAAELLSLQTSDTNPFTEQKLAALGDTLEAKWTVAANRLAGWFGHEDPARVTHAIHTLAAISPHSIKNTAVDANLAYQSRRLLVALRDLSDSLLSTAPQATMLLIDDKPDPVISSLGKLQPKLLQSAPTALDPKLLLRAMPLLSKYQSSSFQSLSQEEEETLEDLRRQVLGHDVVLVDQYLPSNGQEVLEGPAVIRGLTRYLRDRAWSGGDDDSSLPAIIALSRDGDPDRVLDAYRAGAQAYVEKSRPLSIPGVLSRVIDQRDRLSTRWRRNFHGLYRLPPGTIGLLKSARVPKVRIDSTTFDQEHGAATDPLETSNHCFRELLAAIPKAELHLHVGTSMKAEFMVAASVIGLAEPTPSGKAFIVENSSLVEEWVKRFEGDEIAFDWFELKVSEKNDAQWWHRAADNLVEEVEKRMHGGNEPFSSETRGKLRHLLGIPEYLSSGHLVEALASKSKFDLITAGIRGAEPTIGPDQLLRIYVLSRALLCKEAKITINGTDIVNREILTDRDAWESLTRSLYAEGNWSASAFERRDWRLSKIDGPLPEIRGTFKVLADEVATGRSAKGSLTRYLEGCALTGAEHLRHPLLLHLYAQHVLVDFVQEGVVYAELRGSPEGYVSKSSGFDFIAATRCLTQAFSDAQAIVGSESGCWIADRMLGESFALPEVSREHRPLKRRQPPIVSVLLGGKRHKPPKQLARQAAAAAVLRSSGRTKVSTTASLCELQASGHGCRVVGFDLSGPEHGNPPGEFAAEFARLAALNVPLTVHAGENASSGFVEQAMVDLRARRIGHGLSLVEDKDLIRRAREERICVELCPVGNHQTSIYGEPGVAGQRQYPLKRYLEEGVSVCISRDNPAVSGTTLCDEYVAASYAYGGEGLSMWDLLRIVRMGIVSSFLDLHERRAMLDLVDQAVVDLFHDEDALDVLRRLVPS
ncbi:MAG: hypothetical protein AAF662_00040 [Pseudomonadota bacterium]